MYCNYLNLENEVEFFFEFFRIVECSHGFNFFYFRYSITLPGRGSNTNPTSTSTSSNNSSHNENDNRKIRFLQLYTSKSFNSRRNDLLKPDIDDDNDRYGTSNSNGNSNSNNNAITTNHQNSNSDKHVLSPMLVNAIAKNAQVVWANCQKKEGLLGRSDMRLQTAVGMPGKNGNSFFEKMEHSKKKLCKKSK